MNTSICYTIHSTFKVRYWSILYGSYSWFELTSHDFSFLKNLSNSSNHAVVKIGILLIKLMVFIHRKLQWFYSQGDRTYHMAFVYRILDRTIRSSKTKAEMFWDQIMIDKPEVFGEENPFNELIKRAQKDAFGLNEC